MHFTQLKLNQSPFLKSCSRLKRVEFMGNSRIVNLDGTFNYTAIESITIPQTVTSIKYAFASTTIVSITIPENVTCIDNAFEHCSKLKSVNFASNSKLSKIGQRAFSESSIEEITIPS